MLTLAGAEKTLWRRARDTLAFAGFALTYAGSSAPNDDLADPILAGLRAVGITPIDPVQPGDGDVGSVPDSRVDWFLDAATLQLRVNLQSFLMVNVTQQAEQNRHEFGQAMKANAAEIDRLQALIQSKYAVGSARSVVGPTAPVQQLWGYPPWPC